MGLLGCLRLYRGRLLWLSLLMLVLARRGRKCTAYGCHPFMDLFFRRSQEPVNLGLTVIPSGDSQHLTVASSSRYLGAPLHTISVLTKGKPLGHILHVNFALDLIVTLTFVNDKVTVTVEYHPDGLPASRKHTLAVPL